jgi:SSS family solute:Na+ symporter
MNQDISLILIFFFIMLFAIGFFANTKTESNEDFLVGGRKFSLWLSTFCLFATWFGAGTLISATDEISRVGIRASLLEPFGSGFCLILAGLFLAKRLWEMKLLTYSDFFKIKFGSKIESLSVFTSIPIFVGWIAVQYLAISKIISTFTPLSLMQALIIIVIITSVLTILGGMWSVSLTDSIQMFIIIIGLIYLFIKMNSDINLSFMQIFEQISEKKKSFNIQDTKDVINLIGMFSIASLGNLTGQDLGQRIFSAKSSSVAVKACILAGILYIVIGSIPVWFGMTSNLTLAGGEFENVLSKLIIKYMDGFSSVLLLLAIISAVVSTITSALLAPSSILANNYLANHFPNISSLKLCRVSVLIVASISLIIALLGDNVYGLLEDSYAIGFVGFFPALVIGLYYKNIKEIPMFITIILAILIWTTGFFIDYAYSIDLIAVIISFPLYHGLTFFYQRVSR